MNRDAAFDADCRAIMEGLPASLTDRRMEKGEAWELRLSQRGVDVVYAALAHTLAEGTDAQAGREMTDAELSALLGPALEATIRLGFSNRR
jgi:hypothetical protein